MYRVIAKNERLQMMGNGSARSRGFSWQTPTLPTNILWCTCGPLRGKSSYYRNLSIRKGVLQLTSANQRKLSPGANRSSREPSLAEAVEQREARRRQGERGHHDAVVGVGPRGVAEVGRLQVLRASDSSWDVYPPQMTREIAPKEPPKQHQTGFLDQHPIFQCTPLI